MWNLGMCSTLGQMLVVFVFCWLPVPLASLSISQCCPHLFWVDSASATSMGLRLMPTKTCQYVGFFLLHLLLVGCYFSLRAIANLVPRHLAGEGSVKLRSPPAFLWASTDLVPCVGLGKGVSKIWLIWDKFTPTQPISLFVCFVSTTTWWFTGHILSRF